MKVLKVLLVAVLAVVAVLVVVGLFLPATAHVERSVEIAAPPATVFALVNDYRRFGEWSPWADRDPEAEYSFAGPSSGVGARMSWSGNRDVGEGSQEITLSEPYRRIETALDFGDQGTADAFFTFEPTDAGGTHAVWGFDTDFGWSLPGRYVGLFFDRLIGGDYAEGLTNLKRLAESLPSADWTSLEIERVSLEPRPIVLVAGASSTDAADIGRAYGEAFATLQSTLAGLDAAATGPPLVFHASWEEGGYTFDAALPVAQPVAPPEDSPVRAGETPAGDVLRVVHVGPYEALEETYGLLDVYMEVHGLSAAGRPWDEFVDDPTTTPESELRTVVYQPIEAVEG